MFTQPKEGYNQDGSLKQGGVLPPHALPKDDPTRVDAKRKPMPEDILKSQPGQGTLPDIDPEAMEGEVYNMCHFWSNFEIARLDFFRSREYEEFFEMMDRSGGFWMERVSFFLSSSLLTQANKQPHLPIPCVRISADRFHVPVGRRAHPLPRRRRPPLPLRHPLLPRLRLPAHDDPALSRQRARAPTPAHALLWPARRSEGKRSFSRVYAGLGVEVEGLEGGG